MNATFFIRQLSADDASSYRDLRLDGLRRHPEAFGASWADEAHQPASWFAARLQENRIFGAFTGAVLAGTAGLSVPGNARLRHKGALWGMYVRPEARGTGMAPALVQGIIDRASGTLEELLLTFTASNTAAAKLYCRFGFERYGLEPRAFRIGTSYYDMVLMRLSLFGPVQSTYNIAANAPVPPPSNKPRQ